MSVERWALRSAGLSAQRSSLNAHRSTLEYCPQGARAAADNPGQLVSEQRRLRANQSKGWDAKPIGSNPTAGGPVPAVGMIAWPPDPAPYSVDDAGPTGP